MCAIACQSATMVVLCSNVTVSVKFFYMRECAPCEWSLDQLGRHINIVIIIQCYYYYYYYYRSSQLGGALSVSVVRPSTVLLLTAKQSRRTPAKTVRHVLGTRFLPLFRPATRPPVLLVFFVDSAST